ncbi:MAG: hypothetical protein RLN70_01565 [Rhodospirillaceae bacterium]
MNLQPLQANEGLCWQGCKLVGAHFQISPEKKKLLVKGQPNATHRLPRYWAGKDLTQKKSERYVVDMFDLSEDEATKRYPSLMQHLIDWVLPERRENKDKGFREKWWIFGRPRPDLREANADLERYIVTSEVAKHRFFSFLSWPNDLVDGSVVALCLHDDFHFGVLSSRVHTTWAILAGGRLEDRPRYQNVLCFDPFPFPDCTEEQKSRIRALGEQLDKHRKDRQARHPDLTMTGMYNVLEKLKSGEALKPKDKDIHEKGLVSVLKQIHDDLDAAVFDAYGWPADLTDDEILERLVALNHERAAEEKRGIIRWLRPEYQAPDAAKSKAKVQEEIELAAAPVAKGKAKKQAWPAALPEQFQAVRGALAASGAPVTADVLAKTFSRAKKDRLAEVLSALVAIGRARKVNGDKYTV